jgi:Putative adhesin
MSASIPPPDPSAIPTSREPGPGAPPGSGSPGAVGRVPRQGPVGRPGSRGRRVMLVIVLVVAVGVVVALVSRAVRQTRVESAVYRQPVSRVVLDTATGSIDVRPGATGSPVTVQRTLQWSFGSASSEEQVSGDVLSVHGRCGQQMLDLWPCSVSYVVTVPPTTALTVSTSTGSVQVADVAGEVQARTSTGSVDIRGVRSASVSAQTSTGSVSLRFAAAPSSVTARASTGSVEVVVPGDGTSYDVQASTSTGHESVSVPVDSSSSRHISASTSTGSVEVRTAS